MKRFGIKVKPSEPKAWVELLQFRVHGWVEGVRFRVLGLRAI